MVNLVNILDVVCKSDENIVGKGRNAGYQRFLLLPQCFQMCPSRVSLNSGLLDKGISIDNSVPTNIQNAKINEGIFPPLELLLLSSFKKKNHVWD